MLYAYCRINDLFFQLKIFYVCAYMYNNKVIDIRHELQLILMLHACHRTNISSVSHILKNNKCIISLKDNLWI